MNVQEQEELDYNPGNLNSLQQCMQESERGHDSHKGETYREAQKLVDAGRIVVVGSGPAYCRYTDAIIGAHYWLVGDFSTREEANAAIELGDPEGHYEVLPRPPVPPRGPELDGIPF